MVNNIVRSKYIFVENNKIEIVFSNNIFGVTFQSPSLKQSLFTRDYFEDGLWKVSPNK